MDKWSCVAIICVLQMTASCATITKGSRGVTQVTIDNCSEPVVCEATNKKGTWIFNAPGSIEYKKSDKELVVTCDDGPEEMSASMSPTKSAATVWWSYLMPGGLIGARIDASTDARWEYPKTLTLHRKYCDGAAVEPNADGASVSPAQAGGSNDGEAVPQPDAH